MSYISINKLIDTLDKPIKTVAIYFVESYDDFYDEKKINVAPLTLGLTLSDGTKESITFKQLRDILPEIKYIKVPINIFRYIKTSKVKRIIVDGKKIEYRESYYYKSKLEFVKSFNQDKLDDLIKERKEILQANSSTSFDSSDEFI